MAHFIISAKDLKEQLLEEITLYPGLSLRDLSRELHISPPLVKYHLDVLRETNKVVSNQYGKVQRFYLSSQKYPLQDLQIVNLLRNGIVLEIVLIFLSYPVHVFRNQDLYEKLTFRSKGTITYHLNRLVEYNILKKVKGNGVLYHGFQIIDPDRIKSLLDIYKPTPSMITRFATIWINLFSNSLNND